MLSQLGEVSIKLTPALRPGVMTVKLGCQNRKDVLVAETRPDETTDQFCQRLKSMLRALLQSEERPVNEKAPDKKKDKTWMQQKYEIENAKPNSDPLPQQPPSQP
jgi:hypothetical protein